MPPKPPGLLLGIAAWADLPGALQSHGRCSSLGWGPHPWPGSDIPALSWGGTSPAKGNSHGSPLLLQQHSITAWMESLLMSPSSTKRASGATGGLPSSKRLRRAASGHVVRRAWPDQGYCGAVGGYYSITCAAPAQWLISR